MDKAMGIGLPDGWRLIRHGDGSNGITLRTVDDVWGSRFIPECHPTAGAQANAGGTVSTSAAVRVSSATGIETDAPSDPESAGAYPGGPIPMLTLEARGHLVFRAIRLLDQTDAHNELAFTDEWLLHPSDSGLSLCGCLFMVEDALTGRGAVLLKEAPLPHARPVPEAVDIHAGMSDGAWRFTLYAGGIGDGIDHGYPVALLHYDGGSAGATVAIQGYQATLMPSRASFITNTWGDRNRDSRISHDFVMSELEAGKALGADAVQIDDGWQKGRTANSAEIKGVWEGFWAADPGFWGPDPVRFPDGLEPVTAKAVENGMGIGLWFAPDSSDDFTNWERDAETLLRLHAIHDTRHFKVDGIKARTRRGECNLRRFFDRVMGGSSGRVVFDLDVTAEIRPGYFGMMDVGPVFLENRYTDWHKYWPHHTLRNLWKLSRFMHPHRLRMEFLNNARNGHLYEGDPLAPGAYTPDCLFATVMMANPLGWFEASNLASDYIEAVGAIARVWRGIRDDLSRSAVLPIGCEPDGVSWTGFATRPFSGAGPSYVLAFRELNPRRHWRISRESLPWPEGCNAGTPEVLAGHGSVETVDDGIILDIPEALGYLLVRIGSDGGNHAG